MVIYTIYSLTYNVILLRDRCTILWPRSPHLNGKIRGYRQVTILSRNYRSSRDWKKYSYKQEIMVDKSLAEQIPVALCVRALKEVQTPFNFYDFISISTSTILLLNWVLNIRHLNFKNMFLYLMLSCVSDFCYSFWMKEQLRKLTNLKKKKWMMQMTW